MVRLDNTHAHVPQQHKKSNTAIYVSKYLNSEHNLIFIIQYTDHRRNVLRMCCIHALLYFYADYHYIENTFGYNNFDQVVRYTEYLFVSQI